MDVETTYREQLEEYGTDVGTRIEITRLAIQLSYVELLQLFARNIRFRPYAMSVHIWSLNMKYHAPNHKNLFLWSIYEKKWIYTTVILSTGNFVMPSGDEYGGIMSNLIAEKQFKLFQIIFRMGGRSLVTPLLREFMEKAISDDFIEGVMFMLNYYYNPNLFPYTIEYNKRDVFLILLNEYNIPKEERENVLEYCIQYGRIQLIRDLLNKYPDTSSNNPSIVWSIFIGRPFTQQQGFNELRRSLNNPEKCKFLIEVGGIDPSQDDSLLLLEARDNYETFEYILTRPNMDPSVRDDELLIQLSGKDYSDPFLALILKDPRVNPSARGNLAIWNILHVPDDDNESLRLLLNNSRTDLSDFDRTDRYWNILKMGKDALRLLIENKSFQSSRVYEQYLFVYRLVSGDCFSASLLWPGIPHNDQEALENEFDCDLQ